MHRSTEIEVKVGIFVALGLVLVMISIMLLGGGTSLFQSNAKYVTRFTHSEGLVVGANVRLAGLKVGQVQDIQLLPESGQVKVTFSVARKYMDSVKEDSLAGVQTQGVLGDRYIVVSMGTPSSPVAKDGAELKAEDAKDLKDYLSNADEVLGRLKNSLSHLENILGSFRREGRAELFFKNITGFSSNVNDGTKNVRVSMQHLNSIMTKIDEGHGTLGALINDPSLYDDMKALLGGANRNKVLKYFVRKSVEESREAAQEAQKEQQQPAPTTKKKK